MKYVWPLDKVFDGEAGASAFNVSATHFKENLFSLARSYVPFQKFENIYEPGDALRRGTAFKDLDMPECKRRHS